MISHQTTFQIKMRSMGRIIFCTVIDEGALNCIMFMSCWKDLGSPNCDTSTTFLKSLYGHMF
jgi:hypothetical protein